jgi:hypothetical protein
MGMKLPADVASKVLKLAGVGPAAKPKRKPPAVLTGGPAGWSVLLVVPCRVVSEMNERGHWAVRARRFKLQAAALEQAWFWSPLHDPPPGIWGSRLVVEFTHVGPVMDGDNLAGAFKALRDKAARLLGVDDGDPRVEWRYGQRASREPGVEVRIFPRGCA